MNYGGRFSKSPRERLQYPLRDQHLPEVPTVRQGTDPDLLTVVPPADTEPSAWPRVA